LPRNNNGRADFLLIGRLILPPGMTLGGLALTLDLVVAPQCWGGSAARFLDRARPTRGWILPAFPETAVIANLHGPEYRPRGVVAAEIFVGREHLSHAIVNTLGWAGDCGLLIPAWLLGSFGLGGRGFMKGARTPALRLDAVVVFPVGCTCYFLHRSPGTGAG